MHDVKSSYPGVLPTPPPTGAWSAGCTAPKDFFVPRSVASRLCTTVPQLGRSWHPPPTLKVFEHLNPISTLTFLQKTLAWRNIDMSTMNESGHLLCSMPFPEPKQVVDRIRQRFPHLKITYRTSHLAVDWTKNEGLPEGKPPSSTSLHRR